MTTQTTYDMQESLPLIKEMLDKEADKTQAISETLLKIGELAVDTSLGMTDAQHIATEGNKMLQDIVNQQTSVVEAIQQLKQNVDQSALDETFADQLQNDFAKRLNQIVETHTTDKEDILEHISKVYQEYTQKVDTLTNAIHTVNETLKDPVYKERVDTLNDEIHTVQGTLENLKEDQIKTKNEQIEKIDALLKQLNDVSDSFTHFITETEQHQQTVTTIFQHVHIIEDRLNALLAVNATNVEEYEVGGDQ